MPQRGTILFESPNLVVRRVGARGGTCIVTFGSYVVDPTLDREGFAEAFLVEEGIDAIHVIPRDNRWYQYPEMAEALAAVASGTVRATRILTYGSSMGGYAALRFARACRAGTAIAISPQFSIDPRLAPFEHRWQADAARIRFRETVFEPAARQTIFYDPRLPVDVAHVERFHVPETSTTRVAIPYAGHPAGAILAETGVLKQAIRDIIAGSFDPALLRRTVRERRRRSQHHFFMLARRAGVRRPHLAIMLLRHALAIEPESHISSELGLFLDSVGERDEALRHHRAALARMPHNVRARLNLALHFEATGQVAQARRTAKEAARGQSGSVRLLARTLQARMMLRRWGLGGLDRALESGIERARGSPRYGGMVRAIGRVLP